MGSSEWIAGLFAFLGASLGPLVYNLLKNWVLPTPEQKAFRRLQSIMEPLDDMMMWLPRYAHILLNATEHIRNPDPGKPSYESLYEEYVDIGRKVVKSAHRLEDALEKNNIALRLHTLQTYILLLDGSRDIRRQYARNAYEFKKFVSKNSGNRITEDQASDYWRECIETNKRMNEAFQEFGKIFASYFNIIKMLGK